MKYLSIILLGSFLYACNNPKKNSAIAIKIDAVADVGVPKSLSSYIKEKQPGWSLPDTSDYSKVWWSWYERDQIPYYVTTDINDDEVSDYAVILKKSNSVQLHILISSGNTYIPWIDHDFKPLYPKTGLNIEHGLSAVSPGHLDFVVNGKEQSLSLVTNGITLVELENITKIYYWADGKLKVMNVRS